MTHDGEGDWIHKKMTTYVVDVLTGNGWEGARLEAGLARKERHTQSESGLGCRCGLDREVDERVSGAIWCGDVRRRWARASGKGYAMVLGEAGGDGGAKEGDR